MIAAQFAFYKYVVTEQEFAKWYADGILDTLIETTQNTVIHFLPEHSDQIASSAWNSEFTSLLLKKSSSASMGVRIPSF